MASNLGVMDIQLFTNFRLVTNQFGGIFKAKDELMGVYLDVTHRLAKKSNKIQIIQKLEVRRGTPTPQHTSQQL